VNIDPETLGIVAVFAAGLFGEMRLLRRELKIFLAALMERSRRRDSRARRESSAPPIRRRAEAVPESFDDEDTDIHVLMEIERASQRARRATQRRGERAPRPGTHHDRED
jgi:hypothetical protein